MSNTITGPKFIDMMLKHFGHDQLELKFLDNDTYIYIYTYTNKYTIHLSELYNYISCSVLSRKERPGETWLRGNDLVSGNFTLKQYHLILTSILKYELQTISKESDLSGIYCKIFNIDLVNNKYSFKINKKKIMVSSLDEDTPQYIESFKSLYINLFFKEKLVHAKEIIYTRINDSEIKIFFSIPDNIMSDYRQCTNYKDKKFIAKIEFIN